MGWRGGGSSSGIRFGITNAGDQLTINVDENFTLNATGSPTMRLNGVGLTVGPVEPVDPEIGDFWITTEEAIGD